LPAASITVERYVKVVHPVWSKRWLRKWVIYAAMTYAWVSGMVYNIALVIPTSAVLDGVCYGRAFWESRTAELAHAVWNFVSFFVVILVIFVVCYWRILAAIRRQAGVMAGHGATGSVSAQAKSNQIQPRNVLEPAHWFNFSRALSKHSQSNQMQSNVVKTMIMVSAFYIICWMPAFTLYLVYNLAPSMTLSESGYYAVVTICFFYISANPFIYAFKFSPVRRVLLNLMLCKTMSDDDADLSSRARHAVTNL